MRSQRNRFSYRRLTYLALALCLISAIVCMGTDEERVPNVQLTVAETLALIEGRAVADNRFNFFRVANPKANPQLREAFARGKRRSHQITAPLILGYTGAKADAEFLIEWLQKLSKEFEKEPDRVVIEERWALQSVFRALGLMARRDVKPAKQFLTDYVKGKLEKPIHIRWYNDEGDITLSIAVMGYAFLKPEDLQAEIAAAIRRAPPEKRDYLRATVTPKGLLAFVDGVKTLERLPIKEWKLTELRKKAASLRSVAAPENDEIEIAGFGDDLGAVVESAIMTLEKGELQTFIDRMFPGGELGRLKANNDRGKLLARLKGNPDMVRQMIADLKAIQGKTPQLNSDRTVATFVVPVPSPKPETPRNRKPKPLDKTFRFQKVRESWRLFDNSTKVRQEIVRQAKLTPHGEKTPLRKE